ncbi:unnamed protein product [Microthlaspi erraticum]|uniref:Reverse transcriptase zinc-binding domain-containing protein n=1 Tax=Microthlaspi erraticum TaxID=1685480 RepID=A0A6D2ID08_9BRAS|nr:unnamed protein product [Microthlaspi erraticum]
MVNLQKSSIIFGMRIPHRQKMHFQNILGIRNVGGGGKYLGLPEQFGRSKTEAFQGVVNGVRKTVEGWYNQYLSTAAKEVLIKSMAQAKPVYSMNCFLYPKKTCEQIDSILSEFWWGTNDSGRRKISWIAWKRLAVSKNEGGLGFKDLHGFNLALLAKQAWRMPQSMQDLRYQHVTSFFFFNMSLLRLHDPQQWPALTGHMASLLRFTIDKIGWDISFEVHILRQTTFICGHRSTRLAEARIGE